MGFAISCAGVDGDAFLSSYKAGFNMPKRPPVHRPLGWKPREQQRKEFDSARGTAAQRGYDSKWRKARDAFIKKNPLCVTCLSMGVVTAGQCVDHIIPHKGDMKLFWDVDNWQTLCNPCHSRKTATEDSAFTSKKD